MSDLVTGASSGLGQFLARQLGATAGTRESLPEILSGGRGFDRIIHCASVSRFDSSLSELTESNIELTERLLNVSHKRFVFISTIDVYPDRPGNRFDEDFELPDDLNSYRSAYAWSKAMAEKLVLNRAQKPLVLRPTALLDSSYKKLGTALKIVTNQKVRIAKGSVADCVPYRLLYEIIQHSSQPMGIYNVASSKAYPIEQASEDFAFTAGYGEYLYRTPEADVTKLQSLLGRGLATTKAYLDEYQNGLLESR